MIKWAHTGASLPSQMCQNSQTLREKADNVRIFQLPVYFTLTHLANIVVITLLGIIEALC